MTDTYCAHEPERGGVCPVGLRVWWSFTVKLERKTKKPVRRLSFVWVTAVTIF